MAMETSGLTASDVLALTKDNGNLFGGGSGGILALIIVFILIFGNGGLGVGARGYNYGYAEPYATSADVQRGFDTNAIVNRLEGIKNGICDSGYANAQLINGVEKTVMLGDNQISGGITELGYQMKDCCCTTNRNIDSLRYDAQINTRDITDAIHCEGQATRALITDNEMNRLRTDLQSAQLTLANASQTQNILSSIGRYVTNPPCYQGYCNCNNSGVTIA